MKIHESNSILIEMNTIPNARHVYESITNPDVTTNPENVFFLSSQIIPKVRGPRIDKIKQKLERSQPIILVSTQVIEAGVDFDFNVVIRDLGPIDSIVQAAGRCNRNGNRNAIESPFYVYRVVNEQGYEFARKVYKPVSIDIANSLIDRENINLIDLVGSYYQEITKKRSQKESDEINSAIPKLNYEVPPYKREWLPLYEPLGKLASRVLKEGGSLVMSAGHHALPQIFDYMKNSGLKYWWPIVVVKHNGSPRLLQNQHVYVMWKPLLWFVKGNRLRTFDSIGDLIDSQPPRKVLHDTGQSPVDAEYVISKLTIQDDVVFDPLMGAAARTGIAALRLKRRFIGSEKDKDTFALAKAIIDRELSYIGATQ